MLRFAIGAVLMLIVWSSGQAVAQLPDFEIGQVLRAEDLNAIVERVNSLASSPSDVAGTWLGTLTVGGNPDFSVRLNILQTPGLPDFEGSASYCSPVPCEPPVTTMATFTGRFMQGNSFALFPVLTSTTPCAPGSFNVTGSFNEARDQMTMTGGGRNDDCRVGAFTGTFDRESSGFPVVVIIRSPAQREVFADGDPISFQADALDAIGQAVSGVSLVWNSDRDGQIGTGNSFTRSDLSRAIHRITVPATITESIIITVSTLNAVCLQNIIIMDESSNINIVQTQDSICVESCHDALEDRIRETGVRFTGICCPDEPTACVAFNPDSGGTVEGAQCLVDLLGPPYRVDATCSVFGSSKPYQINLE